MEYTQILSDWILEDVNEPNIIANLLGASLNTPRVGASYIDYSDNYGLNYDNYYDYSNYSRYTNYYGKSYYNYGNYSRYTNYYGKSYYNYSNYSNYSNYTDSYGVYTNTYGVYTNTYGVVYGNYNNYVNAYGVVYGNYVCETCQGFCETNQYVNYWLGYKFDYSPSVALELPEKVNQINALIDYIAAGAKIAKLDIDLSAYKVSIGSLFKNTYFNAINAAINKFIDSKTGLSDKNLGDIILASDFLTLKDTINVAKISPTISCCQTTGGEGCITRQIRS